MNRTTLKKDNTEKENLAINKSDIAVNKSYIAVNKSDIAVNILDIAVNKLDIAVNTVQKRTWGCGGIRAVLVYTWLRSVAVRKRHADARRYCDARTY